MSDGKKPDIHVVPCRVCGSSYQISRNPAYKNGSYELKYINEGNGLRYYSNSATGCCPECTMFGKTVAK